MQRPQSHYLDVVPRRGYRSLSGLSRLDGRHHQPICEEANAWNRNRSFEGPSGPTEQAGTLMPLARCPVGGRPLGRYTSLIPASASSCSLRCSTRPHFPFGNYPLIFRTSAFRQSARNTGLDFPLLPPVAASNALRFPFWELTQIPVHGYDSRSGPFPTLPTKGRTCASSLLRHGAPPLGFPHSMAVRTTVTAHCGPAQARRREQ